MLTADERLNRIRVKVERAKKHIRDFHSESAVFLKSDPYVVGSKPNPNIPNAVIPYMVSVRNAPLELAAIAGDAIQNLRTALDHLACQLVDVTGNLITRDTSFPIIDTDSPAEYETAKIRKVKGMSHAAINAIDATKPYKGGNVTLWRLHKLNNIDKHKLLVTVGSTLAHHTPPAVLKRQMIETVFTQQNLPVPPMTDFGIQQARMTITPPASFRKCPLQTGDEIPIAFDVFYPIMYEQTEFTFHVAFNEARIVESESVIETLVQTLDYVDNLVLSFKPLLA